jgi:penicillin amidase
VLRDAHAVPTIRATSEADAYRALGFVHGQDRLWQLELTRRIGRGRLAELVGEAGLPVDRLMRTLGLAAVAEAGLEAYRPEERALLEAYAAGVNAAMAAARPLPPEFQLLGPAPEPWRPADSLLVHRLMALEVSGAWRRELLRARLARRLDPGQLDDLLPPADPGEPVSLAAVDLPPAGLLDQLAAALPEPAPDAGLGSNVFVLAGPRTASGAPLLASDPHLPLRAPGIWYLAALEAPGLEVVGGTIPGLPPVVIGRNREVAWGLTTTGADTEDLVRIRSDPADPGRYRVAGGSLPFETRLETIGVRGGAPQQLRVRVTRFGPVLSDIVPAAAEAGGADEALALQWTALASDDRTVAAGLAMARARDVDELVLALRDFASPVQNVAVADRRGRIGLLAAGRVPIRAEGDGRLPMPGWTGAADWLGHLPSAELPRRLDPPAGLLLNANNRLVGPDYPHLITAEWDGPLRALRLHELLDARTGLDAAAARAVQQDLRSGAARGLVPVLVEQARAVVPEGTPTAALLAELAAWDGTAAADRHEPLLFAAWLAALGPRIWADELGPLAADFLGPRPEVLERILRARPAWCDDRTTARVETCPERVAAALVAAAAALEARLGPDRSAWRWGEQHRAVMPHRPLGELPVLGRLVSPAPPVGGDASTVAAAAWRALGPGGPFPAHHAAGLRIVADLAAPGLLAITATGQVGHPLSGHYRDLTALWAEGRELRLDPARAEALAVHRLRLLPPEVSTGDARSR